MSIFSAQRFLLYGYFIALSVTHRSLSHSTLIKPSDVLLDGTGHITTRVYPQRSHSFTRREEDDLHRRVTTQCDTCDTWQINLPNVREILWKRPASEFGQLSGVGNLTEHPGGFSKVPTSEFGHLPGIG